MIPWTGAYQAPLPMEFSRQEYWSGLLFPSPGDLPNPGIKPGSPVLQVDSSFLILTSQVFGIFVVFWVFFFGHALSPWSLPPVSRFIQSIGRCAVSFVVLGALDLSGPLLFCHVGKIWYENTEA